MIVTKNNGTQYTSLNREIIDFHIENNLILAFVDRQLQFKKISEYESIFVDDISQDEINAGFEKVKELLLNANEIDLLKKYFSIFCEVCTQEAKIKYAKEIKKEEIQKAKDKDIKSGVSYKGKIFQSEEKDRNLLTSTVSLFSITKQLPNNFVWISKDNEAVPFNLEELIELGGIMANLVTASTIKARMLKDRIEQAQSMEEIETIQYYERV